MGQSGTALDAESLDLVITNALILDAVQGVIKADIAQRQRWEEQTRWRQKLTADPRALGRPLPVFVMPPQLPLLLPWSGPLHPRPDWPSH
jgi:hypothetical protein